MMLNSEIEQVEQGDGSPVHFYLKYKMKSEQENRPLVHFLLGGEFPLDVSDFLAPEMETPLPSPQKKNYLHLDTGRSAIYIALLSIIQQGGKREAWLPRYCCPSVLMPFQRLGFSLHFYAQGLDLTGAPDLPVDLDGDTILFIHYFGKTNQAMLDWLEKENEPHKCFIIEDCVQALLNSQLGNQDFAVYSYRKFLPQPDGALLSSNYPLPADEILPANENFVSTKLIAKLIRPDGDANGHLDLFNQAESIINHAISPRHMSSLSHYLLARTKFDFIAQKRRANFYYLLNLLTQSGLINELIKPLLAELDQHEVPLGLPVRVAPSCRDELRAFLIGHKIYCPIHWSLDLTASQGWKNELLLSRSLLTLPLDQRIDESALNYMVNIICEFFSSYQREK